MIRVTAHGYTAVGDIDGIRIYSPLRKDPVEVIEDPEYIDEVALRNAIDCHRRKHGGNNYIRKRGTPQW